MQRYNFYFKKANKKYKKSERLVGKAPQIYTIII